MIDMQLLNGALVALASIGGAAIALSIAIMAAAAITQRSQARHGRAAGGGTSRDLPQQPPETDDARRLVLR